MIMVIVSVKAHVMKLHDDMNMKSEETRQEFKPAVIISVKYVRLHHVFRSINLPVQIDNAQVCVCPFYMTTRANYN